MNKADTVQAAKRFRKSNYHAYHFMNKSGITAESKMMADFAQEQIAKRDEAWLAAIVRLESTKISGNESYVAGYRAALDAVRQEMNHE